MRVPHWKQFRSGPRERHERSESGTESTDLGRRGFTLEDLPAGTESEVLPMQRFGETRQDA